MKVHQLNNSPRVWPRTLLMCLWRWGKTIEHNCHWLSLLSVAWGHWGRCVSLHGSNTNPAQIAPAFPQVSMTVCRYPITLLSGKGHGHSKLSCSRRQHHCSVQHQTCLQHTIHWASTPLTELMLNFKLQNTLVEALSGGRLSRQISLHPDNILNE